MPLNIDLDVKSTGKQSSGVSGDSQARVPLHFAVHKPGVQLESCCGICNLFPGVLLIAFSQVLVGSIMLTLLLTHEKQYDDMHLTTESKYTSLATGAILSGVIGAGLLLIVVALTENCRAMLGKRNPRNVSQEIGISKEKFTGPFYQIYLLVAVVVGFSIFNLAIVKISRACIRFHYAPKIKDEQHRLANLACVSGLFTFLGAISYVYSFIVVFSFYHFRYVRRAILLHETECE